MAILQQKQVMQFETSLTSEEFSGRIQQLVDFNHHKARWSALITKDFFGDKLGPAKFEIRRKPLYPGLFDAFANMCPCVEIEFEQPRVVVTIRNGSIIPHILIVLALVGAMVGIMRDILSELSFLAIVLLLLMGIGMSGFIVYLLNGRYRSVKKLLERNLIGQLKS